MRRIQQLLILAVLLLFFSGCQESSQQLTEVFSDAWEFGLKEYPQFATHQGDHRFNDRLANMSVAESHRRFGQQKVFLGRLLKIDRNTLTEEEKLNYDIFKHNIENDIAFHEFNTHLMPISQMGGFYSHFPELCNEVPLKTLNDYENYISRLEAFKKYAEGHIELMRAGIQKGYVLPKVVLKEIAVSIEPHIVADANASLLFKPFKNYPEAIEKLVQERLTNAGIAAINNSVVGGYQEFLDFMNDEYVPSARESISASELPNGKAYYEHCVRYYTNSDFTPEQVHEIGLKEVERIRGEMLGVMSDVGFEGDLKSFGEFLQADERFYVDSPEELIKEVSFVAKKIDGHLPSLFQTLPRMPFGIKEVPAYIAHDSAGAYYMRAPGDGVRAAYFYINTLNLRKRPLYSVEVLTLHEAIPGHHLQIALQQEIEDVPNFRRSSWFVAFGEGWALYAESLGKELGLYEDPYSYFGRLNLEMWRACRLVVDTGIHWFGWSRQQAIDYMNENTVSSSLGIETEIDRYIVWPGQALAYKIGELRIRELRKEAEDELGKDFDVRQFHDEVLRNGAIPLDMLEGNIRKWIEKEMQKLKVESKKGGL